MESFEPEKLLRGKTFERKVKQWGASKGSTAFLFESEFRFESERFLFGSEFLFESERFRFESERFRFEAEEEGSV